MLVAIGYVILSALTWPFTMDDAFISFRYARNIGDGLGPYWNPADAANPVEGFTSFLHVWTLGIINFVTGADVKVVSKILGVIAGLALLAAMVRETRRYRLGNLASVVALSAFLLPVTAINSVSGMETTVFMLWNFLTVMTAVRLLEDPGEKKALYFRVSARMSTSSTSNTIWKVSTARSGSSSISS